MFGESAPQERVSETLFDLFDRPSYETPELLAERLGEEGIRNLLSSTTRDIEMTRQRIANEKQNLESLLADPTALSQALHLARDKGLE